ncbi:MAG: TetR/AcrR family transcriptional regulator [Saprospiraceae bacterium]
MQLDNRILTKAESLFFKYGIKSISMDDLSRELGISKKTLYQSVDNKKDLVLQVFQNHAQKEVDAIVNIRTEAADAIDEMIEVAKHVIPTLRQITPTILFDMQKYYREIWQLMQDFNQQEIFKVIKENIERGIEEGIYRNEFHPEIIAKLYVGKTMVVIDEDIFPLKDYNKENLFKEHIQYHIRGIATSKGLKLLEKHFKKLS